MSVFISDKDTAKLYVQFFWTKLTANLNISATDNELIYIRVFEAVQKNSQSCIQLHVYRQV